MNIEIFDSRCKKLSMLRYVGISVVTAALLVGIFLPNSRANAISARDALIKAEGAISTLYYLSSEGKRYVFPNEGTYFSWFTSFDEVYEVSMDELVTYPLSGNVTYRPGLRLVKITTDPKVYAVANGGVLRWITSETIAERLYGSDWNQKVDDISDAFFLNYTIGDPIEIDWQYDPLMTAEASSTIGADLGVAITPGARRSNTWPDIGNAREIRTTSDPPESEPEPEPEPPSLTLIPHSESGIYTFTGFAEPERLMMGWGDTHLFPNGITLEIVHAIPSSTRVRLYFDDEERLYYPTPDVTLRTDGNPYLDPYLSVPGIYIYLGEFDEESQKAEIEVYSAVSDLYQRCLSDPLNKDESCLVDIGRLAAMHESYDEIREGKFKVVYPKEIEAAAQQMMEYLPGCYEAVKNVFVVDQPTDEFSVFFFYPEGDIYYSAAALPDGILIPFFDYSMDNLEFQQPDEPCGVGFAPLAHEMVHVFDYNSQITHILREGFANYLSHRFDIFDSELVCSEDGYQRLRKYDNSLEPFVPYPEDSNDDTYNVGECYFIRLEERFGRTAIDGIVRYLGETRNIESQGEIGIMGNVNFFDDVIEPLLGTEAVDMAEQMNIDVTCDHSIPTTGYLCEENL